MEKELFEQIKENDAKSVVLDASGMKYISSAGLRVILKLKKTISNSKVINASPEVYEIFSITGFADIIEIKKAFREISVEGCEIIGQGGHGTVYRINDDTILKLYSEKEPLSGIEREIQYARNAFVAGIPTAIPFEVVKCGSRYGSVFELIKADTLGNVLNQNPDQYDVYSKKYVEMINTLHTTEADTGRLSNIKSRYNQWTDDMADVLTAGEIGLLHEIINSVPDRNTFVHGDIHTKNVMVQNGELILIDMADMTYGHPIFDYAGKSSADPGNRSENRLPSLGRSGKSPLRRTGRGRNEADQWTSAGIWYAEIYGCGRSQQKQRQGIDGNADQSQPGKLLPVR